MTEATDAVVVAATRTPIGRSGRSLAGLSVADIGMQTVTGVIDAAGLDPDDIDDLILGEVLRGGGCTARYVANALGLPPDTPGGAVQRQCATGMMAFQEAAANIRSRHGRRRHRRRDRLHDPHPDAVRDVTPPLRRRPAVHAPQPSRTRPRHPTPTC